MTKNKNSINYALRGGAFSTDHKWCILTDRRHSLPRLYNELSEADKEHNSVSLTHDSEWYLSVLSNGLLIWENVAGEGEPKHMKNINKEKVLYLWQKLASGNIEEIDNESWEIGY